MIKKLFVIIFLGVLVFGSLFVYNSQKEHPMDKLEIECGSPEYQIKYAFDYPLLKIIIDSGNTPGPYYDYIRGCQ